MSEKEIMPCPVCGTEHEKGVYGPRPELRRLGQEGMPFAPPDVECSCGMILRVFVPFFSVGQYGWQWIIIGAWKEVTNEQIQSCKRSSRQRNNSA